MHSASHFKRRRTTLAAVALSGLLLVPVGQGDDDGGGSGGSGSYVVFGYNDLGMHCMDDDYSQLLILPPFNTLRAQVLRRGHEPDIITGGVSVTYSIPAITHVADKTNFWKYAQQLFGVALPPDVGLTGHGLRGQLSPTPDGQWEVTGIPLVPIEDSGRFNPYPLGTIRVLSGGSELTRTQTVVPVSQELSCNLCHGGPGVSPGADILEAHDQLHGTHLTQQKPVLCASCHADPALGTQGAAGVPTLSSAMHTAHAPRVGGLGLTNVCYACHPGIRTQCQRDVHLANGVVCIDCHGDMTAVGDPGREPWSDLPRCGNCHSRPGFVFEEPGKLFKDSRGHGNVHCAACHGSPHAITPTLTATDNVQANRLQGHSGVINDCLVCHTRQPGENFFHRRDD